MATARNKAVRVRWRPVSAFMVAVMGLSSVCVRRPLSLVLSMSPKTAGHSRATCLEGVFDQDIEQNQGSRCGTCDQAKALFDELADRLAVAAQQPGQQQE